jgi:hypothetical protein
MMKKRRIGISILLTLILGLALLVAIPATSALAATVPDGLTYGCNPVNIQVVKCWDGISSTVAPPVKFVVQVRTGPSQYQDLNPEVSVTLDGVVDAVETVAWKASFTGNFDSDHSYRVREILPAGYVQDDVDDSYNSGSKTYTYTFTNKIDKIDIKVKKTWSADPGSGSSATFTLYSKIDGGEWVAGGTQTIPKSSNNWYYFEHLPVIDAATGDSIEYKVEETSFVVTNGNQYVTSDTGLLADGGSGDKKITFTNTKVNYSNLEFKKTWVDTVEPDATRPALTFDLYANGTKIASITLDGVVDDPMPTAGGETDNWEGTFFGLPDIDANGPIDYEIREDALPGYEVSSPYSVSTLCCCPPTPSVPTFTNTRKTVEIKVTKAWDPVLDEALPDGFVWPTVTINLLQDDVVINSTTLSDQSSFTFTTYSDGTTPLPLYQADGETPYVYTLEEVGGLGGYTPVFKCIDDDASEDGFLDWTVTNTRDLIDITVNKVWLPDDLDGYPSITVILYRDGTEIARTGLPDDITGWSYTFTNLPTHSIDGLTAYTYTVDEETVPEGYAKSVSRPVGTTNLTFTITNVLHCHIDIPVTKVWESPAVPQAQVTIKLMAVDNDHTGSYVARTMILNGTENPAWYGVFTNVDQYDSQGEEITYWLEEVALTNFAAPEITLNDDSDSDESTGDLTDGFTVKNRILTEKTSIPVIKVWSNDSENTRPQSVTFILYADGSEVDRATFSGTEDIWHYTFTNLPTYTGDPTNGRRLIVYTIEEVAIGGRYYASVDGFTITNTYRPHNPPEPPDEPEEPPVIIPEPEPPTDEIPDVEPPLDDTPQTGDQRDLALPVMLAMISVAAFATVRRLAKDQAK